MNGVIEINGWLLEENILFSRLECEILCLKVQKSSLVINIHAHVCILSPMLRIIILGDVECVDFLYHLHFT